MTPEAHLLHAMPNFRDLGGLPAAGGRALRRGLLFRAPVPRALPAADMARLKALKPTVIIDLRGETEAAERPSELPEGVAIRRAPHPVEPRTRMFLEEILGGAPLTHQAAHEAMVRSYRGYVEDLGATFASALRVALGAAARGDAAIFHCTAGKDRTGLTAALILSLIGTPKPRILDDYLATNALWKPDPQLRGHVDEAARSAMFSVHPEYLESAFDALDRVHGGAYAFAVDALGGEGEAKKIVAAITEPA